MKNIYVSAAVIRKEKKIFVTQRGYGEFKDGWEFPGGKVEAGENSEEAVKREIQEELGASIEIERFLTSVEYDYPKFHLKMDVYLCHLLHPKLELREAEAARWVDVSELDGIAFLPADKLVLPSLKDALRKGTSE